MGSSGRSFVGNTQDSRHRNVSDARRLREQPKSAVWPNCAARAVAAFRRRGCEKLQQRTGAFIP
ncbi:MAG: hypothetical protein D6725_01820 [Planctomycetota bacterium]|nr:MAG: hypothetical protein D6725_01820 [Planctomycetota bacterium]